MHYRYTVEDSMNNRTVNSYTNHLPRSVRPNRTAIQQSKRAMKLARVICVCPCVCIYSIMARSKIPL